MEVVRKNGETLFSLFASGKARRVCAHIYKGADDRNPELTIDLKYTGERWCASYPADLKGRYYTFQVDGMRECAGVFAKAVAANGRRAYIVDMESTNPEGWAEDRRPRIENVTDHVIYELHYRDFSTHPSSRLTHKGKFLSLTEPRAIQHLVSLGVNTVQLMPSFDFASIDETRLHQNKYNWGYDPLNHNVPEGSYATDPFTPEVRILEFKQMVQALHKAGIRVVMDVVYNHTYTTTDSNFELTYPGYYFRHRADGGNSNGSGCGNETASEQPMMRHFMVESMRYWVEEYHIDGFRVDLMGVHDIETMNLIRRELDSIDTSLLLYGEGWSASDCAYPPEKLATKGNTRLMPRIATFCDDLRDAMRGPFNDDTATAFMGGMSGHEESIKYGIVGCVQHNQIDMRKVNYSNLPYALQPSQAVVYVSCHDDMCLVDRLRSSVLEPHGKCNDVYDLIALVELAQTAVFTSQGIPLMFCGEEMLRTKHGVHNSYRSSDAINQMDWGNLERYPQLFAYYRGLIALRKAHRAFRLGSADLVRRHLTFIDTQSCVVAWHLHDLQGIDVWSDIVVVLNANGEGVGCSVTLPEGDWTVVCSNGIINSDAGKQDLPVVSGNVCLHPRSAMICYKS